MPWFKVDDGFAFHPKAIMAGNAALGLWVRAGAWCGANLTDGYIPKTFVTTMGAQKRDAEKLVAAGLWVHARRTQDAHETNTGRTRDAHETNMCASAAGHRACGDHDGYQFHEWSKMQPSKAEVEEERAANRKRQQEYRERKRNGVTDSVTNTVSNSTPSRPVPTRPIKEEAKASSDSANEFMEWYLEYPRKASRGLAEKAYTKARKKATAAQLLEGVKRYASDPNREQEFTKLPATWLNAGSWDDEPLPARGAAFTNQRPDHSSRARAKEAEMLNRLGAQQEPFLEIEA